MMPTGRQTRPKGEGGTMEKFVVGGEEAWKNGLEKILTLWTITTSLTRSKEFVP